MAIAGEYRVHGRRPKPGVPDRRVVLRGVGVTGRARRSTRPTVAEVLDRARDAGGARGRHRRRPVATASSSRARSTSRSPTPPPRLARRDPEPRRRRRPRLDHSATSGHRRGVTRGTRRAARRTRVRRGRGSGRAGRGRSAPRSVGSATPARVVCRPRRARRRAPRRSRGSRPRSASRSARRGASTVTIVGDAVLGEEPSEPRERRRARRRTGPGARWVDEVGGVEHARTLGPRPAATRPRAAPDRPLPGAAAAGEPDARGRVRSVPPSGGSYGPALRSQLRSHATHGILDGDGSTEVGSLAADGPDATARARPRLRRVRGLRARVSRSPTSPTSGSTPSSTGARSRPASR